LVDHTIVHFEIPADNVEKLRRFYTELFAWKIEKTPGSMDYWIIETVPMNEKGMPIRAGVNGGIMKRQHPEHKPTNYIAVESVDRYVKKIEALGGKVLVPKTEVPGIGWWAMAMDPEGNQFAILESMNPQ
jgi:predicted enzyme related to lactoylglutathione lyase